MDKKKFLKVKIKSLAEEARIIRLEECKAKSRGDNETRESLYLHRIRDVRNEARATQLAYGYLRGKSRRNVEQPTKTDWLTQERVNKRAFEIVKKYGSEGLASNFSVWYA